MENKKKSCKKTIIDLLFDIFPEFDDEQKEGTVTVLSSFKNSQSPRERDVNMFNYIKKNSTGCRI